MSDTPSSDVLPSPDDQAKQAATRDYERAIAECKSLVQLERENADLREDNRKLALHTAAQATELADLRAKLEVATRSADKWKELALAPYDRLDALNRQNCIAAAISAHDAAIAHGKGEK